MKIKGIVSPGRSVAHDTLKKQIVFFKKRGLPYIDRLKTGTINLHLNFFEKYKILKYDFLYTNIQWHSDNFPGEDFGFIKVLKLLHNGKVTRNPGYLYFPLNNSNTRRRYVLEIWSVKVNNVQKGDMIQIEVNSQMLKTYKILFNFRRFFRILRNKKPHTCETMSQLWNLMIFNQ